MTVPRQFLIYQGENGSIRVGARPEAGTLWLNQKQLPEWFDKVRWTIYGNANQFFNDGNSTSESTVRLSRTVRFDEGHEVNYGSRRVVRLP